MSQFFPTVSQLCPNQNFTKHCMCPFQEIKTSLFSREIAAKICQLFIFVTINILLVTLVFPELQYLKK